jgi:intracellular septation protein A
MRDSIHKLAMKLGNNTRVALIKMIQGGLIFVFGVLILMIADRVIAESLAQEIMALFGLILAGCGVLWTLVGYLSMSILRIYHMIKKKD